MYDQLTANVIEELRALKAERDELLAALRGIVVEADAHPFNPIGFVIEHVITTARTAIAKADGKA